MAGVKERDVKVAIVAPSSVEGEMLHCVARECGFTNALVFTDTRKALEVAKRQQFGLFISFNEFPGMTALTMMQTLRSTGNYGVEQHLFLVDPITPEVLLVLVENNITHALTKPFSADRIAQKLTHLWHEETNMSPFETAFREAHAAYSAGLMDMAMELAMRLLKLHGLNEKLLLLLGDAYSKTGHPTESRKFFEKAMAVNPGSAAAAHKLAHTYMLEKDFAKAADLMNELVKLNPLNIELLAHTGLSNFEIGNFDAAKGAMCHLQKLDSERKDAAQVLAQVAIKEGDYETALAQMTGNHDKKEIIQLLNNEGIKLAQKEQFQAAIEMYLKGLTAVTESPYVYALYYNLGLAYSRIHDNANAAKFLRKAIEIKPDFEKATLALSRLELKSA